ncbi:MAG: hypothetical protein CMB37_00790 [Euryarchaeota archaeon]|nr:hypothetical protein [Euryarchaeota archaeon]
MASCFENQRSQKTENNQCQNREEANNVSQSQGISCLEINLHNFLQIVRQNGPHSFQCHWGAVILHSQKLTLLDKN